MISLYSLVRYTPREGEPHYPALVTRIWDDNTYQLYVFHFEATAHVRSVSVAQLELVFGPDEIEQLARRVSDLENDVDELRAMVRDLQRATTQVPASVLPVVDASELPDLPDEPQPDVDSTSADNSPESLEETPVLKKRKAAWPR